MTAETAAGTKGTEEAKAEPKTVADPDFEPELVAFCCQFCAYAAADLAGVSRLQYPTNVKILRLMCTGKIDLLYLLRAFEDGADGVMVAGCLPGNCHFLQGNTRAKKRVVYAKKLLEEIGLEPERLEMFNMSAAMSVKFAETIIEMTDRIRKLGPSPLKGKKSKAASKSKEG